VLSIEATEILKKIEKKFIKTKDLQTDLNHLRQYYNHWAAHVKNKIELKMIDMLQLEVYLSKYSVNAGYRFKPSVALKDPHGHGVVISNLKIEKGK
jgi:hypothetical protein